MKCLTLYFIFHVAHVCASTDPQFPSPDRITSSAGIAGVSFLEESDCFQALTDDQQSQIHTVKQPALPHSSLARRAQGRIETLSGEQRMNEKKTN